MDEGILKSSGVGTLDASNLTYQFERVRVNYPDIKNEESKLKWVNYTKEIPSNLEYLEDTYDAETGTSASVVKIELNVL